MWSPARSASAPTSSTSLAASGGGKFNLVKSDVLVELSPILKSPGKDFEVFHFVTEVRHILCRERVI